MIIIQSKTMQITYKQQITAAKKLAWPALKIEIKMQNNNYYYYHHYKHIQTMNNNNNKAAWPSHTCPGTPLSPMPWRKTKVVDPR